MMHSTESDQVKKVRRNGIPEKKQIAITSRSVPMKIVKACVQCMYIRYTLSSNYMIRKSMCGLLIDRF